MALIALDMDGVVVDSKRAILQSISFSLVSNGIPDMEPHLANRVIGPPLQEMMSLIVGESHGPDVVASCVASYRKHNDRYGPGLTQAFPGVDSVLSEICMDHDVVIATSKNRSSAVDLLDSLGLSRYFVAIDGSSSDSDPESKSTILARLMVSNGPIAAMVGDRMQDIAAAKEHGIATIGAAWGYAMEGELEAASPSMIIGAPSQLPWAISRTVGNRSH